MHYATACMQVKMHHTSSAGHFIFQSDIQQTQDARVVICECSKCWHKIEVMCCCEGALNVTLHLKEHLANFYSSSWQECSSVDRYETIRLQVIS